MQFKILLKPLLLVAIIIEIVFFSIAIFLIFHLPDRVYSYHAEITPDAEIIPYHAGLPIRLIIPKINIDTLIDSVGLTSDGAVGVPKGPADVAWFDLGSRPGDNGSAVITGHYGRWKNGQGSVFDDLDKLTTGDEIYVRDEKGTDTVFVVRELKTYGQNEYAPEVFGSEDGKAHLNLITCKGIWIEDQKTYSNRLVVFTDKKI